MADCPVLVVDDAPSILETVEELLRFEGYEVRTATNGLDALAEVERECPHVVVLDMRMPVMNGAELVHRIRRADPALPAIVITAYTNDDDLAAARHEGLLAVLPKPAPISRLVELASAARRGGLVAVIEDDPQLSDNLSEILRQHGFAAVTAASVTETERLGDVSPFAALVDLRLPGGPDGSAMTRLARKYPNIPMVVVTGYTDVTPPEPHHGLFLKPFDSGELVASIERLYASARA
jgi:DNA-binding NtrC family response regulator